MQPPEGYRLQKRLGGSSRSQIYRAVREADGREVLLKAYTGERSSEPGGRAAREFEALRAVAAGCAVLALDLDRSTPQPLLVLEDFAGSPPRPRLDPGPFLEFAVPAARALAGVHSSRLVHRALQPESFLVKPGSGELRLTGFERAAPLGAAIDADVYAPDAPLRYLPPEASGRIGRGMDARSDLYALGAIFYELLTGLAPFESTDPQELMAAHVARRPRPLLDLRADLSATLTRVVLRLLEKEPEDRYQTAEALAVDLAGCREQFARTGRIDDDFPLGSADAPYRPLFRRVLYGREREAQALIGAYRSAAAGTRQLMVVRGAPGIGKSALVPELHRPLALEGGYLAQGKFDLYRRHLPYAAFAAAFASLVEQIAGESASRQRAWCDALLPALGNLAAVLVEWLPGLGAVLGVQPALPALGARETQQRLGLAVRRFLHACSQRARPLVLFLDDLQWADAGSLYLLEELLHGASSDPLLVLCAYRAGEVDGNHAFSGWLSRAVRAEPPLQLIELGPLSRAAVTQMLADALGGEAGATATLAEAVERASGNNPLLVQQCVLHLHGLGAIRFERPRGWVWDAASIAAADLPDDALGMMVAKVARLPAATREVLMLASCAGDSFAADLLLELRAQDRRSLEAALYALSDEGLIAPAREGFRFVHDRVREAAQAQLSAPERAALHCDAARFLLARTERAGLPSRSFEIADHWILGRPCMTEAERPRVMEIHALAGKLALAAGAAATAARYFEAGLALFREADWAGHAALGFELHLQGAESAYQTLQLESALERLAILERRSLSLLQRAAVTAKQIGARTLRGGPLAVLPFALEVLRPLGVRWPARPGWLRTRLAIAWTDLRLRRGLHASPTPELGMRPDELSSAQIAVMLAAATPTGLSDLRLGCLSRAFCVRLPHPDAVNWLLSYAQFRTMFLGPSRASLRHQRWLLSLWRNSPARASHYKNLLVAEGLRSWSEPRQSLLEPLRRIAEAAREAGDIEWVAHALRRRISYAALGGERLQTLASDLGEVSERGAELDVQGAALDQRMLAFLRAGDGERPEGEIEAIRDALLRPGLPCSLEVFFAGALCALGLLREAELAARAALRSPAVWRRELRAPSQIADCQFALGMAAGALGRAARGAELGRQRRALRAALRVLRGLAREGPAFAHMAQALEAEWDARCGRPARALERYASAAERAQQLGNRHHAALILGRSADQLERLGRTDEASATRQRALVLTEEWGARAHVESRMAQLR